MMRRAFLIGAAIALFTLGCGSPPAGPGPINPPPDPGPSPEPTPPPPPPTLRITRILAFGDSMTAGTTAAPLAFLALDAGLAQSYPFKLQQRLSTRYSAQTISVFNAGWAGRRAAEDRERFVDMVRESSPEVILLLEGANDLNNIVGSTNAGIDFAVGSMEEMVKHAVARGIPIFVISLPEQRPGQPNTANAALVRRYNDALRTMAQKKGAMFIDLYAQFPLSLIGHDGLHPTEAGYDKFGEIFLDAIRQQYRNPRRRRWGATRVLPLAITPRSHLQQSATTDRHGPRDTPCWRQRDACWIAEYQQPSRRSVTALVNANHSVAFLPNDETILASAGCKRSAAFDVGRKQCPRVVPGVEALELTPFGNPRLKAGLVMKRRARAGQSRQQCCRTKSTGRGVAAPWLDLRARADGLVADHRLPPPRDQLGAGCERRHVPPASASALARCVPGDVRTGTEPVAALDRTERYRNVSRHSCRQGAQHLRFVDFGRLRRMHGFVRDLENAVRMLRENVADSADVLVEIDRDVSSVRKRDHLDVQPAGSGELEHTGQRATAVVRLQIELPAHHHERAHNRELLPRGPVKEPDRRGLIAVGDVINQTEGGNAPPRERRPIRTDEARSLDVNSCDAAIAARFWT